jgi:hypothetical protein
MRRHHPSPFNLLPEPEFAFDNVKLPKHRPKYHATLRRRSTLEVRRQQVNHGRECRTLLEDSYLLYNQLCHVLN